MHTKLHIDLSQGVVDVEGDLELVREIYSDFKDNLLKINKLSMPTMDEGKPDSKPKTSSKPKRRRTVRKKGATEENGSRISADKPKMDKDLDTSGLREFYDQFEAKNNPERILVFLKFLTDHLKIDLPNTDQVYTCYDAANERVPKVFSQAFRDAGGRNFGFIHYNSPTDLVITTKGNNYFKLDLKRKDAE